MVEYVDEIPEISNDFSTTVGMLKEKKILSQHD